MMDCKKCFHYWNNGKDEYCETRGWNFKRTDCPDFQDKSKPITNADSIRMMTDEELAEHIVKCVDADFFRANVMGIKPNSKDDWLDWLRQRVSDGR